MFKAIAGLTIAGVFVLALTGCGGGDSTISKSAFDKQLEIVCNKGLQGREEVMEKLSRQYQETVQKSTTQLQSENVLKLIAAYQRTTEEIDDLDFPQGSEQKVEELVEAREKAAATVEADPIGSISVNAPTFDKANKVAEELEAKSCGT
ncbi:MAG: hypothetical protein ACJ75T_11875 [Solirubrobacterales bacterium]